MRNRHLMGIAVAVAGSVAGLVLCFTTFDTIRNHLFDMAMGLLVVSGIALVQLLHHAPADRAYAAGYDLGESHGYLEGRRTGRPVVVPLRCSYCGAPLTDLGRHQPQPIPQPASQATGARSGRSSS